MKSVARNLFEEIRSKPGFREQMTGILGMMKWNIALGDQAICMMSGAMENECDELIYPFQPLFYNEIEECLHIEICTSKSQK